jgi:hypothetical protein
MAYCEKKHNNNVNIINEVCKKKWIIITVFGDDLPKITSIGPIKNAISVAS